MLQLCCKLPQLFNLLEFWGFMATLNALAVLLTQVTAWPMQVLVVLAQLAGLLRLDEVGPWKYIRMHGRRVKAWSRILQCKDGHAQ